MSMISIGIKHMMNDYLGRDRRRMLNLALNHHGRNAVKIAMAQLLTRITPTFYDVQMLPLCTCGYSIANGQWRMPGGALLRFVINACFISFASVVVLSLIETPKVKELSEAKWKRPCRRMIRNMLILLSPSIAALVLVYLAWSVFLKIPRARFQCFRLYSPVGKARVS